jgi:hypothetical protein
MAVLLVAATIAPGSLDAGALAAEGPQQFRAFGGSLRVANQAAQAVALLTIVAGAVSLVVRFRRGRGIERQQVRWVALAAGLTGVAMGPWRSWSRLASWTWPAGRPSWVWPCRSWRQALQPPPLRRRPHHRGVQCAAAPAGRPGRADR